jgi:glycosyltransferase involved in cell wall biosynthesis
MTPLVSILIPAHNARPWIAETLESALAVEWTSKEIIVVDDGSSDGTLDVARSFESRGVRVFHQANQGASSARNRAWRESRGRWLQFLDADDLLHPRKISLQLEVAGVLGETFAYCADWTRFINSVNDADFTPQPLCRDSDPVSWITTKLRDNVMMHPGAWLVSRHIADIAGPWNETLTLDDDGEFFSRIVFASEGVRYCKGALSYYRSHTRGSLSRRRTRAAWESGYRSLELTAERLASRDSGAAARQAIANAYQRLAYSIYPDEADLVRLCEDKSKGWGGTAVLPGGGVVFDLLARTLGWRAAAKVRYLRALLRS